MHMKDKNKKYVRLNVINWDNLAVVESGFSTKGGKVTGYLAIGVY